MQSDFKDLIAWQKAMKLANRVYDAAELLPRSELFVLSQQMRDAALSIPSNIAEGRGRWTPREFRQFLRHARGSSLELQSQIIFSEQRGFFSQDLATEMRHDAEEVARLINGLIRYLNNR